MSVRYNHKNLIVWQKSRQLVKEIYLLTKQFPQDELFCLTNQLRRAAISVPSNIAEGYNRHSRQEFLHYLRIAKGSAAEVETQLILSMDLEYISKKEAVKMTNFINQILNMLASLIIKTEKKLVTKG